ncbi:hypothetical protein [Pyramidobacter piscolens]|uniref:hypothetical protein n=1 Tax=Pyramidobacter piscolens TaxID=638849 RepID=UPI0012EA3914|nr:hypothetical protein [Pyramidobacter piscolens]
MMFALEKTAGRKKASEEKSSGAFFVPLSGGANSPLPFNILCCFLVKAPDNPFPFFGFSRTRSKHGFFPLIGHVPTVPKVMAFQRILLRDRDG